MQHPTLPCIFSSMTLFFVCHALAANMFVLVSPKDSPKRKNKKKPLWLKTNSVAGSCPAAGCCLPACHHQTAPNTALDQQQSCCRAVAEGPCGDESQHSPHWLRSAVPDGWAPATGLCFTAVPLPQGSAARPGRLQGSSRSRNPPPAAFPAGSSQLISSQIPKLLNGLNQLWDMGMPVTWAHRKHRG